MSRPLDATMQSSEQAVLQVLNAFFDKAEDSECFGAIDLADAIGVLAVNGVRVQISYKFLPCVALYPTFSMVNHSCFPNASYEISANLQLRLKTKVDLKKNREVTISYIDLLGTTQVRGQIGPSATRNDTFFSLFVGQTISTLFHLVVLL